jgi:membrane associated rhomboid family serine protease
MGSGVPEQTYPTPFKDRKNEPDQWWRFIVPIFLHAGIIHLGFNMLLQMTLGRDMEKEIGSIRFAILYFSAGIFGFVLGGNYAAQNIPSVGASGSLFGVLALVLLDLLYNWSSRRSPVKDLLFLLLDIAIAFVLGLLPGLDNFSHIGGFLMGIVLGICILHSPASLRERIGTETPYATVDTAAADGTPAMSKFVKQPLGFFKGRKPFWWAWWLARVGALVAVFIGFILLLRNFYEWRNECSWCYRLTCLVSLIFLISGIWIYADSSRSRSRTGVILETSTSRISMKKTIITRQKWRGTCFRDFCCNGYRYPSVLMCISFFVTLQTFNVRLD